MTAERHEWHALVDHLPEDQVAAALADVRRRLPRGEGKAWAPEFFGVADGADLPAGRSDRRPGAGGRPARPFSSFPLEARTEG